MKKILIFAMLVSMIFLPKLIFAGECKEHIELHSADYLAKEYGKSAMWVLNNVKIALWENPIDNARGKKVGQMLPGSRALILETRKDYFKVKSPLDKSTGWINKIQVKGTLFQDTVTREPCKPK